MADQNTAIKAVEQINGANSVHSNDRLAQDLFDIAEAYMDRKNDSWNYDYDAYMMKKRFREKLKEYRSLVSG